MNDYKKTFAFKNGYGASVVSNDMSYGGERGLFEVAVLKDGEICYDTTVTNDVIGFLDFAGVEKVLTDIENL